MVRPHAITDHTTLFKRRGWAGRPDGRSNADPLVEIDSMTTTERRIVTAFKQALGDHKTHKLSMLMQQADLKALTAELKLPHTKVRHILKNVPKEIMCYDDSKSGHTLLALKQASTTTASSSQDRRASTSRQDSQAPSTSTHNNSAQISDSLFRAISPEVTRAVSSEDDSVTSDTGSDRSARRAAKSRLKAESSRRHSDSTWGMQRPHERQQHTKEVANASISPQKQDKLARPGPRRSQPVASTSASVHRDADLANHSGGRSVAGDSDDEEDLLRAIRQSMSAAPPSRSQQAPPVILVRKHPASPSIAAIREMAAEYGLELADDTPNFEQASLPNENGDMAIDEDADVTFVPSQIQENSQEEYGVEIPIDQAASQSYPNRSQETDEENGNEFDMDIESARRSQSVRSHHRTSSGGGSARKDMPDLLFDGYKATRARGRSARPGPPGMEEASTRDSSVQDAESIDDRDLETDIPEDSKPIVQKRGPTKPGRRYVSDGSSSDDVVVVTSVRVGAPPGKSREERELEREERRKLRKEKEARKLEQEKSRKRRERNPLPTFRNTQAQEANELKLAYQSYLTELQKSKSKAGPSMHEILDLEAEAATTAVEELPDLLTEAEKNARWTQMFSYESLKGRGNRPDYNTVKFWPYNLPFPGRAKDEAIVAVAGGCVVRVFRLSEKRGVTELWNAVDESVIWEKEAWRETFYTCAWTHDIRQDNNVAPHWRKWPILCVAGKGAEVKILDGYSGATLKIIQGHGGAVYSLAIHPSLPHIIATASGDEAISLWDISVPVSKPEVEAGHGTLDEADKRRKGYVEGERLCLFGGYAGHVEAVLSIAIHPSLPLLISGGGDCKLRIWRLPDNLPAYPTSSLINPTPVDSPEKSTRPASNAFPIFVQTSLHSHHIDHVEWVGNHGHVLTRSLCFNAPGKRVVRLFRPKFFDILEKSLSKPLDIVGFGVDFPSQVELLARWTTPSCSGGIGDGVMCTANELVRRENGKMVSRRRVYVPSIEPAVHIYDLDLKTKQSNLEALVHEYPFKLGEEMLFEEDKGKNSALRAVDCQNSGRGWLVSVGEGEKIVVWVRKRNTDWKETKTGIQQLLRSLELSDELESEHAVNGRAHASPSSGHEDVQTPQVNGDRRGDSPPEDMDEDLQVQGVNGDRRSRNETGTDATFLDNTAPRSLNGRVHAPDSPPEAPPIQNVADISSILRNSEEPASVPQTTLQNGLGNVDTSSIRRQLNGVDNRHSNLFNAPDAGMSLRSPSVEYVTY